MTLDLLFIESDHSAWCVRTTRPKAAPGARSRTRERRVHDSYTAPGDLLARVAETGFVTRPLAGHSSRAVLVPDDDLPCVWGPDGHDSSCNAHRQWAKFVLSSSVHRRRGNGARRRSSCIRSRSRCLSTRPRAARSSATRSGARAAIARTPPGGPCETAHLPAGSVDDVPASALHAKEVLGVFCVRGGG